MNSAYTQPQGGGLSDEMLNYSLMSQQQGGFFNGNNFSQGMSQGEMMMQPSEQSKFLNQGNHLMSDYDMMALLRAKEKLGMMQRGPMMQEMMQDRVRAFSQDQYSKGQGLPLSSPTSFDNYNVSSVLDNLGIKRSSSEMQAQAPGGMPMPMSTAVALKRLSTEEPAAKRRKKAKKPSDMPRRALSAYNIFFSEQREVILKELAAKEKQEKSDDASTTSEDNKDNSEAKTEEGKDEKDEKEVPSVLNRTFFPKRTKRAHRKVHGKIGLVKLARTVSQRWKELCPEKRQHYKDLAEKDKERHAKVMAEYQNRKAAESIVSMGSPEDKAEEAPVNVSEPPRKPSEQEKRESLAEMMQQKILADMFARQPSQQQNIMGMSGMSGMQQMMSQHLPAAPPSNLQHNDLQNGMLGANFQQHNGLQNGMLGLHNTPQMWPHMGMGNF